YGKADRGQVCGLTGAAREAEVGEHRAAVGVNQHVGGFQVAVDDARVVRVLQAVADLAQVAPRGQRVERAAVEDVTQRASADQGHGEERVAVEDLEVVDRQDVRMVELGERFRLRLEALDEAVILEKLGGQRLERDLAAQRLLHGTVDDGHPTTA